MKPSFSSLLLLSLFLGLLAPNAAMACACEACRKDFSVMIWAGADASLPEREFREPYGVPLVASGGLGFLLGKSFYLGGRYEWLGEPDYQAAGLEAGIYYRCEKSLFWLVTGSLLVPLQNGVDAPHYQARFGVGWKPTRITSLIFEAGYRAAWLTEANLSGPLLGIRLAFHF